ncbi:hypothetical protein M758_UG258200 [Ceratodon purpureus]|nr:hypothetical protein M758_UG258200 [Ceratodon purpureus]
MAPLARSGSNVADNRSQNLTLGDLAATTDADFTNAQRPSSHLASDTCLSSLETTEIGLEKTMAIIQLPLPLPLYKLQKNTQKIPNTYQKHHSMHTTTTHYHQFLNSTNLISIILKHPNIIITIILKHSNIIIIII